MLLVATAATAMPLPAQADRIGADIATERAVGYPTISFPDHGDDSRAHFLREMPGTIRADHPAIVPVAGAICQITKNPLEQLVLVNDVTHLLVDYDEDARVYGMREYHATLDEMLARRREAGWLYLRDDCDGRAVFAAHLLASLGISWRLEASFWKCHAWVVAEVGGVEYDLLDLRGKTPETSRTSYRLIGRWVTRASNPPPYFDWRTAWAQRTNHNLELGMRLGMLQLTSTAAHPQQRYSTDWTRLSPGERSSPFDGRLATATQAGFPLGEALKPGLALARAHPAPEGDADTVHAPAALGQATTVSEGR